MINWKCLFSESPPEDVQKLGDRSKMLEKLFAANKGMAKMTGESPETMEEMMRNPDILDAISGDVSTIPEILEAEDEFGTPDEELQKDDEYRRFRESILSGEFKGVTSLDPDDSVDDDDDVSDGVDYIDTTAEPVIDDE